MCIVYINLGGGGEEYSPTLTNWYSTNQVYDPLPDRSTGLIQIMAARWRPWSVAAKAVRGSRSRKPPPEPIKKWNIVRGDLVSLQKISIFVFQIKPL